jgi:SAM-dependent methyltransferase
VSESAFARQGRIWSSAPFDVIAEGAAPTHDALVEALRPVPGISWLDVATGTGPVALRAARAGAEVTALDAAPALLATARRKAAAERLRIRFDLGAAEALPYADGSFDVVSSAQGVIFALEPRAAASELARVCRTGGRLGLTCLVRAGLSERIGLRLRAGGLVLSWGEPAFVRGLLGGWFELEFSHGDAPLIAASAEAAAELYLRCYPPLRFFVDHAGDRGRAWRVQDELIGVFRRYETTAGVRAPRPYLLVTGVRNNNR